MVVWVVAKGARHATDPDPSHPDHQLHPPHAGHGAGHEASVLSRQPGPVSDQGPGDDQYREQQSQVAPVQLGIQVSASATTGRQPSDYFPVPEHVLSPAGSRSERRQLCGLHRCWLLWLGWLYLRFLPW